MTYRFSNVYCSQCGEDQGPGDHGFSHCQDHPAAECNPDQQRQQRMDDADYERRYGGPFTDSDAEAA